MSDDLSDFWRWASDEAGRLADDVLALGAAFWDAIDALPFVPERRRFRAVDTQFYGHGAFMGAAPALLADARWRRILGFLMPDVFAAVRAHVGGGDDPSKLMVMMENNPVLAAFGTVRAAQAAGEEENANHLVGMEWDVFVDTALIEAWSASSSDAAAAVMDRVVDTALIAHAGAVDTVQESFGISQYPDVRATPKADFGGVEMDAWLDLFGRALALAHAGDFDAAVASMAREPRSESSEPCMLHTFEQPWPVARVVAIHREVTGRNHISIIIDIKSRDSTPEFLSALVRHLNAFGVHVAAVGSFGLDEIRGVGRTAQRVEGHTLPGPREVLFFHWAGDLQLALDEGRVPPGQSVMFNGASLLEVRTDPPGSDRHQFTVPPALLDALEARRAEHHLMIGIYVQEGDCEAGAAAALAAAVRERPDTFGLGFAWGGLRDEAGLPPATLPRAGYGGQALLGVVGEARAWTLADDGRTSPANEGEATGESDELTLTGRLTDAAGAPLAGLFVAVVDEDLLDSDDLLGVGRTDDDGRFGLAFLPSEFQQDWFEDEETPDIKIIVSAPIDELNQAVFQRSFGALDWSERTVDLGDVVVEGWDPSAPKPLPGVEPTPGHDKAVARLDIDDDLLRRCLAEVAPIVERLTGWRDLLDGVNVDVCDGLSGYSLRATFEKEGIDPASIEGRITTLMAEYGQAAGAGCALYDPGTHTIAVNRKIMEQVSLGGLKVMLGHELVHLGQFKYTPGLHAYNQAMVLGMDLDPAKVDLDEVKSRFSYMSDLEGYALYIQTDFLQARYYPMTIFPYHEGLLDSVIRSCVAMMTPGAKEQQEFKASQYTDGREPYRRRQRGDLPARWEFDVASLPGGAEFVAG